MILLESGADICAQDINGKSALHLRSSFIAMRSILEECEKQPDLSLIDADGRTPLHTTVASVAYDEDRTYKLILLLDHGFDPSVLDNSRNTAEDLAHANNFVEAAACLSEDLRLKGNMLEFAMSTIPRLGEESLASLLDKAMIRMILEHVNIRGI